MNFWFIQSDYARSICEENFTDPGGFFKAFIPEGLLDKSKKEAETKRPLLPTFLVQTDGQVISPGKSGPEVDLPTLCAGESARWFSVNFLSGLNRPLPFTDTKDLPIKTKYVQKKNIFSGLFQGLLDILTPNQ